ncbi:MAG: hypothetical protein ACRCUB_10980 [Plesiomonas shigelloides]
MLVRQPLDSGLIDCMQDFDVAPPPIKTVGELSLWLIDFVPRAQECAEDAKALRELQGKLQNRLTVR